MTKNMVLFVVEKGNKFEKRPNEVQFDGEPKVSDSDLEVSLTKGEDCDLKILRLAEEIVAGEQEQTNYELLVEQDGDELAGYI